MTASSVTGIGPGSADDGLNKGSEHMTLGVEKLLGPRVMAVSKAVLSGGAATVTFPQPLPGSKTNYFVFLTTFASAANVGVVTDDADGNFASFTIAGTGSNTINWVVVRGNTL